MRTAAVITLLLAAAVGVWLAAAHARSNAAPGSASTTSCRGTDIVLADSIRIDGSGADVQGSTVTIIAGGTYCVTGSLADGKMVVDTSKSVGIVLDNVSITNESGPALEVVDAEATTIVLADGSTNSLRDGESYDDTEANGALFSNDPLIIAGNGILVIDGRFAHGIAGDDNIVFEGGDIHIEAVKDGVHANDNITVLGGTITVTAARDGLESEGDLVVDGGELVLAASDCGIASTETVTINDGTITVESGFEGIESKNIDVNGGSIAIAVEDDGLNAMRDVSIHGGRIYIAAGTDAVDSNGTITIDGGLLVALGGRAPEGGLDCNNCEIELNGGIVIASGGQNSKAAATSEQHVAVLGQPAAGSAIRIETDGVDVLTFVPEADFQSLIFSSPDLAGGTTYEVLAGGAVSGGEAFHGLYTGADFEGGRHWASFTAEETVTYVGIDS